MSPLVATAVSVFIRLVLGSQLFSRVEASVQRWAERELSGAEKRGGVLGELQVIGVHGAEWALRLAIELAVGKMRGYEVKK